MARLPRAKPAPTMFDMLSEQDRQTIDLVMTTQLFSTGKMYGLFTELPETVPELSKEQIHHLRNLTIGIATGFMTSPPFENIKVVNDDNSTEVKIGPLDTNGVPAGH